MPILAAALLVGIGLAWITNGDLRRLERAPFRLTWVIVAAAVVQLVIFPPFGSNAYLGAAVPYLYVASLVAILVVLVVNRRTRGMPLAALGVGLNFLAIAANGGYMPASRGAVEAAGLAAAYVRVPWVPEGAAVHQNSLLAPRPRLLFLGDVFSAGTGPLATVFSIGDVALALGVLWLLFHYSRRPAGRHRAGARRLVTGEGEMVRPGDGTRRRRALNRDAPGAQDVDGARPVVGEEVGRDVLFAQVRQGHVPRAQ